MKPLAEQSLYEILEVPPDAGSAEIAAAIDGALSTFGPGSLAMYSLMSPEDQSTLARRMEEARTTLLDPAARTRYDAALTGKVFGEAANGAGRFEFPPVIPALVLPARPVVEVVEAPSPPAAEAAATEMATETETETETTETTSATETTSTEREAVSETASTGREAVSETAETTETATASPTPAETAPPTSTPDLEAAPPPASDAPEPSARPAHTPAPGGHVWPSPSLTPAAVEPPTAAPLAVSAPPAAAPRPIQLEREVVASQPPPPAVRTPALREAPIPEFAAWSGDALRHVREARGLSLKLIAERTKVTRHHIENIEADRYSALPAPVYLRGILLTLARELRLDGQKVSRSYLERMASAPPPPQSGPPRR